MALQNQKSKDQKSWFARHKIITIILVFFGFIAIAGAVTSGSKPQSDSQKSAKASTNNDKKLTKANNSEVTVAKLGEPARDGQFEFVVKSVTCGKPSVTDSSGFATKNAQGQYCLVDLTVKNIGDKQQYFTESDQKLLSPSGQQYSADTTATLYNSNSSDVFLSQINPGNSVQGIIVFDIPKEQSAANAELHDSAFSNGIKVELK